MQLTIFPSILIAAFVGVVIGAFSRKRKVRFKRDAGIPFDDGKR